MAKNLFAPGLITNKAISYLAALTTPGTTANALTAGQAKKSMRVIPSLKAMLTNLSIPTNYKTYLEKT